MGVKQVAPKIYSHYLVFTYSFYYKKGLTIGRKAFLSKKIYSFLTSLFGQEGVLVYRRGGGYRRSWVRMLMSTALTRPSAMFQAFSQFSSKNDKKIPQLRALLGMRQPIDKSAL